MFSYAYFFKSYFFNINRRISVLLILTVFHVIVIPARFLIFNFYNEGISQQTYFSIYYPLYIINCLIIYLAFVFSNFLKEQRLIEEDIWNRLTTGELLFNKAIDKTSTFKVYIVILFILSFSLLNLTGAWIFSTR